MESDPRLEPVLSDLRRIFGERLESAVTYGAADDAPHSLALVASLTLDDLTALAAAAPTWHEAGAATPLVVPHDEFAASLDAFPAEYGEIIDTHAVLHGSDPFTGISIDAGDLRRAVEVQAASLLLHLRENYIERGGRPRAVEAIVRDSAPTFAALLRRMARLDATPGTAPLSPAEWATSRAGLDARVVGDPLAVATDDSRAVDLVRLFPSYLSTVAALRHVIDRWPID